MLGTGGIRSDIGQIDFGLLGTRQFYLGFLSGFLETLQRQWIVVQINAVLFLEFSREELDQTQVKVFTAEERVTVRRQHLKLVLPVHFGDFNNRNIKGTATQVVDRDRTIPLRLIHTVGQCRCRRFIDDALDFKACNFARIFRRLALGIVEVCRHGNDRLGDRLAQILFRGLLHLAQYFGRDLGRGHLVIVNLHPCVATLGLHNLVRHHFDVLLHDVVVEPAADQSLHCEQRVLRVGHRLTLCRLTDQNFLIVGVSDNRRGCPAALCVFDHSRLTTLQHGYAAVGGAQINTNNLSHVFLLWSGSVLCGPVRRSD